MFFNVLFGSLIAFNFYEPLASLMASNAPGMIAGFSDMLCFLGIFLVATLIMRVATENIAPSMVRFPSMVYQGGRFVFGLAGGALTVAVVILAFNMAPVHKKLFTAYNYDHKPPFGMGFDYEFLAFFQRISGYAFAQYSDDAEDPFRQYGKARVFDPRGRWMIDHQNARYGEGKVPEPITGSGASSDAAATSGETPSN